MSENGRCYNESEDLMMMNTVAQKGRKFAERFIGRVRGAVQRALHPPPRDTVFVMCPITCYETPHYRQSAERIRALMGNTNILFPSGLWKSNEDWLNRWPAISHTVRVGIVFGEPGTALVGKGVVHEAATLERQHVPVYWLRDDGSLSDKFHFELYQNGWSWKKYAEIKN